MFVGVRGHVELCWSVRELPRTKFWGLCANFIEVRGSRKRRSGEGGGGFCRKAEVAAVIFFRLVLVYDIPSGTTKNQLLFSRFGPRGTILVRFRLHSRLLPAKEQDES